jgi:hypothetical protein
MALTLHQLGWELGRESLKASPLGLKDHLKKKPSTLGTSLVVLGNELQWSKVANKQLSQVSTITTISGLLLAYLQFFLH